MDLPVPASRTQLSSCRIPEEVSGEELPFCRFFIWRKDDAPAFPGHLLCYKDSICKEGGTGWGVLQVGLTGELKQVWSHTPPASRDQKLLLISHLPVFTENNKRKTQSRDEFQHLNAFADKPKSGQWTVSGSVICRLIWITCLGEYSLNSMCFSGAKEASCGRQRGSC